MDTDLTHNQGMHILVVDDSPAVAQCLKIALEAAGHTVSLAATFRQAMAILEAHPVNAVIADGEIPTWDPAGPPKAWGPDLTAWCRRIGVRAVLYSASDELVAAERTAGGMGVVKPAETRALLALLRTVSA